MVSQNVLIITRDDVTWDGHLLIAQSDVAMNDQLSRLAHRRCKATIVDLALQSAAEYVLDTNL